VPSYRFAGLTLSADFPMPELPRVTGGPEVCATPWMRVQWGPPARSADEGGWTHEWRLPDGTSWMRVARRGRGWLVRFPALADFDVGARAIVCHALRGVPRRTVRHLLLDQLLPARLASARRLVVHASAVSWQGRTIGFMGPAGSGKSTLAAALVARGATLVTDDALVMALRGGRVVAVPTYPGLRLWPGSLDVLPAAGRMRRTTVAHYTRKERWTGHAVPFAHEASPLTAVYVVAGGRRASMRRLDPRQTVMALVRHTMMLDVSDRRTLSSGMSLAAAVAAAVPIVRLAAPRGRRGLEAVCDLVTSATAG
jgi:hypothetical protein